MILTTHYMDEALALADRLAIMAGGLIVAEGTPDDLDGRDRAAVQVRFHLPPASRPASCPSRSSPTVTRWWPAWSPAGRPGSCTS